MFWLYYWYILYWQIAFFNLFFNTIAIKKKKKMQLLAYMIIFISRWKGAFKINPQEYILSFIYKDYVANVTTYYRTH